MSDFDKYGLIIFFAPSLMTGISEIWLHMERKRWCSAGCIFLFQHFGIYLFWIPGTVIIFKTGLQLIAVT